MVVEGRIKEKGMTTILGLEEDKRVSGVEIKKVVEMGGM
jgi:hypothetical protein